MKFLSISFFLLVFTAGIFAQSVDKLSFEADFVTKVSTGKITRETIQYSPGFTVNIPDRSKYLNPVYSMEVSVRYQIMDHVSIGIGSGISTVKFDNHPFAVNEYSDRILYPLVLKSTYKNDINKGWFYTCELGGGHQFADFRFGWTDEGFLFRESGGFIGYFNTGIGKVIGKYKPILSVGYEMNQFSHEHSLGWIEGLNYSDKIFYKTKYHLLRVTLGIIL